MASSVIDSQPRTPLDQGEMPNVAQVESCLKRIRSSAEFVRSERMVRFLEVTVRHTLENNGLRLTERLIGCEVFDRPPDWDPSTDTIVRTEARRLRAKLEQYYERLGNLDPVRIYIPKGGYVARFEVCPQPEQAAAHSHPAPADTSAKSISRRIASWGIAGTFLLVIVGVLYWEARRAHEANSQFDIKSVTSEIGTEYGPAIAPDGEQIAYVWDDKRLGPDIYLRSWTDGTPHRLNARPAQRVYPSWSRDGNLLAYLLLEGDEVFVVVRSLNSEQENRIAHMKRQVGRWSDDASPLLGPPGPSWTSNGDLVIADYDPMTATGSLLEIALDGQRTTLLSSKGVNHYLYPRVSPDGRTLAYVRYTSHGVGEVFIMPVHGGTSQQLTKDSKTIQGISWSPDGKNLLFSSNRRGSYQLWSVPFLGGEAKAVPTNSTSATDPLYAPNGDILFVDSRENWNIWRRSLNDSNNEQRIIASSGRNYDPRYSPDGKQIAFVSDRTGTMELWVSDAEGNNPHQLTHLGGTWLGGIAWAPDGTRLAFDARTNDRSAIYLVPQRGGEVVLVESNLFEERMPAWSKDGKTLFFNSNRDGEVAIWGRDLAGGMPKKILSNGMFAVISDGDKLYLSTRVGTLWQSDLQGGHLQPLAPNAKAEPVMSWSVLDGSVYYTRNTQEGPKEIIQLSTSGEKRIGHVQGSLIPNAPDIAISPDAKFMLFAKQDMAESDLKLRHTTKE